MEISSIVSQLLDPTFASMRSHELEPQENEELSEIELRTYARDRAGRFAGTGGQARFPEPGDDETIGQIQANAKSFLPMSVQPQHKAAVEAYAGKELSFRMNKELRAGTISPEAQRLTDAVASQHLPRDIILHRGIVVDDVSFFRVGGVFADKGFSSTSLTKGNVESAMSTAKMRNPTGKPIYLEIKAPKGAEALSVVSVKRSMELEVILQRGLRFRVDKILDDGNVQVTML